MPAVTLEPAVDLRPAAGRDRTPIGWLDSPRSSTFGPVWELHATVG